MHLRIPAFLTLLFMSVAPALAHLVLLDPVPRSPLARLTTSPCGDVAQGPISATWLAGSDVRIVIDLSVSHGGGIDAYLSYDNFNTKIAVRHINASGNGIYTGMVPVPVAPRGTAILQVVHSGYYSCADIVISSTAAVEPQLDPLSIDFGDVNGGDSDLEVLAVSNIEATALEITSVSVVGEGFTLDTDTGCDTTTKIELRAGEACAVPVRFDADIPGDYQGVLYVALGSGQVIEVPLTATSVEPGTAFGFGDYMSASFYDPLHQGEGYLIEVLSGGAVLIYWFSYDETGAQRWFVGLGQADADGFYVAELYVSEGGIFGPQFKPEEVLYTLVGSLWISFDSCGFGIASYLVDGRYGTQQIQRLTQLAGLSCE